MGYKEHDEAPKVPLESTKRLGFTGLTEEAEKEARSRGVVYDAADGNEVLLRPVDTLADQAIKHIKALAKSLSDKKTSDDRKIELVDELLLAVASPHDPLAADLPLLPLSAKLRIFEVYSEETKLGEDSA